MQCKTGVQYNADCSAMQGVQCNIGRGAGQVLSTKQGVHCTWCTVSQGVQCKVGGGAV